MHPYDIPEVAHPPIPELETPSEVMPPEWVNAEALHAAVATAQHEVTAGEAAWTVDAIIEHAKLYREFITGEWR